MEFTKAEKRLLDISLAQKRQGQIFLLFAGILFIVAGIGVWTYGYLGIIPAGESSFKQLEAKISGVPVQTQSEATLKQMLLLTTKKMAKDRKTIAQYKFIQTGFFMLFCGLIFITVYYKDKAYHGLVRKLKTSET
jgi:hypothetical protein